MKFFEWLNCSRQWGKATVTAAEAAHRAFTKPEGVLVVLSPKARQNRELFRKAGGFARRLGIRPRGDGENQTSLLFPNGSRIVGIAGDGGHRARVFGGEPDAH